MNAKQAVFKYIEDNPDLVVKDLVEAFPGIKPQTAKNYFYAFRKGKESNKPVGKKNETSDQLQTRAKRTDKPQAKQAIRTGTGGKSVRQKVIEFLEENPDSSTGELSTAFPDANRKTLRNYRYQWKKNRERQFQSLKAKQDIFDYLDDHPDSNLQDLKKIFSENNKKIVTIFRSWKQRQTIANQKRKTNREIPSTHDSENKTLKSLEETVKKQRRTIEKQKFEINRLKTRLTRPLKNSILGIKDFIRKRFF